MANPKDTGSFDFWITNRIFFDVVKGKSGGTGDFDHWLTDRINFDIYVEVVAGLAFPILSDEGIHSAIFGGQIVR